MLDRVLGGAGKLFDETLDLGPSSSSSRVISGIGSDSSVEVKVSEVGGMEARESPVLCKSSETTSTEASSEGSSTTDEGLEWPSREGSWLV